MVCLSLDPKKSRISGGSKAAVENAAKKLFLVVNFEGMWLDWETNIVCGEAICISLLHIVHFIPWQPACIQSYQAEEYHFAQKFEIELLTRAYSAQLKDSN